MVYAHISIRPAFQRSPSGGTSKEDPGAAFCCVLLTLFGSTASYTTISKCIDCDETIPGIPLRNFELSSISSIL